MSQVMLTFPLKNQRERQREREREFDNSTFKTVSLSNSKSDEAKI